MIRRFWPHSDSVVSMSAPERLLACCVCRWQTGAGNPILLILTVNLTDHSWGDYRTLWARVAIAAMNRWNAELMFEQLRPGTRVCIFAVCLLLCVSGTGCYAPLHSHGTSARLLSDEYRWPQRTAATPLNYSSLVGPVPSVYLLGAGDRLDITVADLIANGNVQSFQVQVLNDGTIHLPRSGPIVVGGLTLAQTQEHVNKVLTGGLLQKPGAIITLTEKGTVNVLVLGAVQQPGVHALPRYENDVAHALAAAQGFAEDAGDVIEIHRRSDQIPPSCDIPLAQPRTFVAPDSSPETHTNSIVIPQNIPPALLGETPQPPSSRETQSVSVPQLVPETRLSPRRPGSAAPPYAGPVPFPVQPAQTSQYTRPRYDGPVSFQPHPSQMSPSQLPPNGSPVHYRVPTSQVSPYSLPRHGGAGPMQTAPPQMNSDRSSRYGAPGPFQAPPPQMDPDMSPRYGGPAPMGAPPTQMTPYASPPNGAPATFQGTPSQRSVGPTSRYGGYSEAPVFRGQSPTTAEDKSFTEVTPFPSGPAITRIPLRGGNGFTNPADVVLHSGDVLVVPRKTDKVFYVVGPLSEQNSIRFSVNDKDREIGGGLLLPDDREIDVVTAVVMAGYIDPINSPTTVTLHRVRPDGIPLLIRIDLIEARHDPRENILVQAGDIIYLNPDPWWYMRRTFDLVIDRGLGTALGRWLTD
ncbi:MAG TPA: hypothetical protein EYQ63_08715 [Fuerstia sp.]|nr:hypothetical protein [Fuerstiella sp.]